MAHLELMGSFPRIRPMIPRLHKRLQSGIRPSGDNVAKDLRSAGDRLELLQQLWVRISSGEAHPTNDFERI